MADNYKASDLAELAAILALNAKPHGQTLHRSMNKVRNAVEDAKLILNCARKLHAIGDRECEGYPVTRFDTAGRAYETHEITEEQQAALDKQRTRCQKLIREAVDCYRTEARLDKGAGEKRCALYFQADPRGCPVHIAFLSDTWIGG